MPVLSNVQTIALLNLIALTLDALGGLFLAYDLLGGENGPLRALSRMFLYGLLFVIGHSIFLGPVAGVVLGVGLAFTIGIAFSRAAQHVDLSKKAEVFVAVTRAVALGAAATCLGGIKYGATFGTFCLITLTCAYLLKGASPAASYDQEVSKEISLSKLKPSFARGLAVALASGLTSLIWGESFWHGPLPLWIWMGIAACTVSAAISISSTYIENMLLNIEDRQMGMIGTILFLIGFVLQSIQYLQVFLPVAHK